MRGHIAFIASDELEGRDTPSRGLDVAAKYIATSFEKYGLKKFKNLNGFYQPVPMEQIQSPESIELIYGEVPLVSGWNILYISGKNKETTGSWLYVDYSEQDIDMLNFNDKIIISIIKKEPGYSTRQILKLSRANKAKALEKGAIGFVEILETDPGIWNRLYRFYSRSRIQINEDNEKTSKFLHIMVHDDQGDILSSFIKPNEKKLGVIIENFEDKEFETNYVIGFVEGTDPELKEEYIICSAHYDHLGIGRQDSEGDSIYNGARDNAIGVMSVLMAAENIARHPLKRSVIFVLFTGEEKGLLGSKWMSNHPPVDLGDIVFCLNSDGGGYNDTTIVTIIGARRINTYDVFDKACEVVNLIAFDGTDAAQSLFNSSDNIVFAQKGIPALTFSTGFRDMDTEIMKYYHQPSDEAETIDYNYLEKFSLAFGISLREIADSNDRFFWNDDDEFFPIGKKLYEK